MAKPPKGDIESLVRQFDSSDWTELHVKTNDFEVYLSTNPNSSKPGRHEDAAAPVNASVSTSNVGSKVESVDVVKLKTESAHSVVPEGMVGVTAPNLGTFYSAPKPGAAPYVSVGDRVTADTEVCLIEVMKLFTPVRSGIDGVIKEICVADAEMIEYQQLLVIIDPA
ncbi:MAG: acetyl-CoA carboxylase, biotin carboxyl carrier protein [Proteobacteria bacterium]|jgi:acetyl-CoA carboxylase biotin carboxyl carrier protein|nr:acetyl-CoA carboxylase, biotin carboxyl carrier protein [Pseudomonadota bacterium]